MTIRVIFTLISICLAVSSHRFAGAGEPAATTRGRPWVTPEIMAPGGRSARSKALPRLETVIVKELVPHIDATYRTLASREGRLLDGYSMGGSGAARLGFKYPDLFRAVSIMGGGPLQADLLDDAPRAGRRRATEVLAQVYGDDPEYFRLVSPRALAEQHAEAIKRGSLIRIVCGAEDETFANNRDFHEHLERLGIPHMWTVLAGVDHNPRRTLEALGDSNWAFYRQAFAQRER